MADRKIDLPDDLHLSTTKDMGRYDPIQMVEMFESEESGFEGDGSSSKRKRPAPSEHAPSEHGSDGSSFKCPRPASERGSDRSSSSSSSSFSPEGFRSVSKHSIVSDNGPAFGEIPLPDCYNIWADSNYTPLALPKPGSIVQKELLEALMMDNHIRCQEILNHYNFTKGCDYELVEVVKYEDIIRMPFRGFHFNFLAKKRSVDNCGGTAPVPKSRIFQVVSSRADADDGSPKLFYADLWESDRATFRYIAVAQCEIVDPSGPVGTCKICNARENGLIHPKDLVDPDEPLFWRCVDPLPSY